MSVVGLSRVVFAAYNNLDRWLQPSDSNESLAESELRYRVRSRVVSASINEPSGLSGGVKKLVKPVEFLLLHTNVSRRRVLYYAPRHQSQGRNHVLKVGVQFLGLG